MLNFLVLHTTETHTEVMNYLDFICANILYFSGQTESHVRFSKLLCKCNFSRLFRVTNVLLWFLSWKEDISAWEFVQQTLFQQMQVIPYFEDTLLPHSLAWSDETLLESGEDQRGSQGARILCTLPGWLGQTHSLLMTDRHKSAKLFFPECSCILCWCIFFCYFSCSFAISSSLGFA